MQKVLIISYFFPPCNLTAASRVGSWKNDLPEFGIYPIVVTRNWTGKELSEEERLSDSGKDIRCVKEMNSTCYYMPYKSSFRDQCFIKGSKSLFYTQLSKILTFCTLILQNLTLLAIPYRNIYEQARKVLKEDPEVQNLIISGNLFEQFYFGYLLKKEFPYMSWIADYRDEWTSSELNDFGFLRRLINHFQAHFEKKWVKSAAYVTANTNYSVKKLARIHNKKVVRLLNGFDNIQETQKHELNFDTLEILHNGTLYPTQKLDLLQQALSELTVPANFKIVFSFPGVKIKRDTAKYVEESFLNLPVDLILTERLPKEEVLAWQHRADLFLMVAHHGKKGIVGSKLYEYLSFKKKVILCPTDKDELEETLLSSGLGIIIRNKEELKENLNALIQEKMSNGYIKCKPNDEKIDTFTRKKQVEILAKLL